MEVLNRLPFIMGMDKTTENQLTSGLRILTVKLPLNQSKIINKSLRLYWTIAFIR